MNHKWQTEIDLGYCCRRQSCIKCGIWKEWIGGDIQHWLYFDPNKEWNKSYDRPECS